MPRTNHAVSPPPHAAKTLPENEKRVVRSGEIKQLLKRAAELAAADGVSQETFMTASWAAYLEARPGLREEMADATLRAELASLRERGLLEIA